ncbi:MAG: ferrous iron transport protein A [Candidatus Eisenbacteria bacterium]|nr:ferrous iron transport protein A [Candidatus Eisenbacteria bacterium]
MSANANGPGRDERPLARLAPGEDGRIERIDAEPAITRRLMELGLVPGSEVRMVRTAPLGDPIEVAVRGLRLSLRRSEAECIHVALR